MNPFKYGTVELKAEDSKLYKRTVEENTKQNIILSSK